jgi:hypothetical protein
MTSELETYKVMIVYTDYIKAENMKQAEMIADNLCEAEMDCAIEVDPV